MSHLIYAPDKYGFREYIFQKPARKLRIRWQERISFEGHLLAPISAAKF